jgi:hypothetical protein
MNSFHYDDQTRNKNVNETYNFPEPQTTYLTLSFVPFFLGAMATFLYDISDTTIQTGGIIYFIASLPMIIYFFSLIFDKPS